MPAMRMIAEVGGRPNVTGMSSAMPVMGPMPGRTPTIVPRNTPTSASSRLKGVTATLKPSVRFCQKFTVRLLSHQQKAKRARRQLHAEQVVKDEEEPEAERHCDDGVPQEMAPVQEQDAGHEDQEGGDG